MENEIWKMTLTKKRSFKSHLIERSSIFFFFDVYQIKFRKNAEKKRNLDSRKAKKMDFDSFRLLVTAVPM
jgi:hypothetical protein